MKKFLFGLLATFSFVLFLMSPSYAMLFDEISDSYTAYFLMEDVDTGAAGTPSVQDLSANLTLTLTSANSYGFTLGFTVNNTSADFGNDVGLNKISFGMNPIADSITLTNASGDPFVNAILNITSELDKIWFGFSTYAEGATTSTNTGYNRTLNEGESDSFSLFFSYINGFNPDDFAVFIEPFAIKFQTGDESFETGESPPPVPEPTTMILLGTGLLGIAGLSRKFKK